jgi:hypothetical protein
MDEFFNIIFGEYSAPELFGFLWFFLIAYIIYGLTEVSGRDKSSPNTPNKFSLKFWFKDNWRRYLVTILCSYMFFKFYMELSGHPFGNFDAVTLGLLGDGAAATIKKRVKAISGDREELTLHVKREQVATELKSDQKDEAEAIAEDNKFIADELKDKQDAKAEKIVNEYITIAEDKKTNELG